MALAVVFGGLLWSLGLPLAALAEQSTAGRDATANNPAVLQWDRDSVEYTIGNGQGPNDDVVVTLCPRTDLSDVTLSVDPQIDAFVEVNPNHFTTLRAGASYPVSLRFSVP